MVKESPQLHKQGVWQLEILDIDQEIIKTAVKRSIEDLKRCKKRALSDNKKTQASYTEAVMNGTTHLWIRPPTSQQKIASIYNNMILREQNYYSAAYIIKRTNLETHEIAFYLRYEEKLPEDFSHSVGTGGFETYEKAVDWFDKLGR